MDKLVIVIDPMGYARHLNHESTPGLQRLGPVRAIYRNSHVEPYDCLDDEGKKQLMKEHGFYNTLLFAMEHNWFADMRPVEGPILGPYDDRPTALQAEIDWLEAHNLPLPQNHDPGRPRSPEPG